MMEGATIFDRIVIAVPREKIYRRLGYRRGITALSAMERASVDEAIEDACSRLHLRGAGKRLSIKAQTPEQIILSEGTAFRSTALSRFIDGCREIILLGATGGTQIIDAIHDETTRDNLSRAVVYDATASEMVDGALEWIMRYYRGILRREGRGLLKRRFSAGYGDFALEHQKIIYDLLGFDRIGVSISNKSILIPEKSVTAVTGIT